MFPSDFEPVFKRLGKFFNKTLTPEQEEIWFDKIKFLKAEAFSSAVEKILFEEKSFPNPKIVLDYARDFREQKEEEKQEKCDQCRSTGYVHADNPRARPSTFSFRCGCVNGKRLSSHYLPWCFDREKEGWVKR